MKEKSVLPWKRILCFALPIVFSTVFTFLTLPDDKQGIKPHVLYLIPLVPVPLITGWRMERCLFGKEKAFIKIIHLIIIAIIFFYAFIITLAFVPFNQVRQFEAQEAEQQYISADKLNPYMPKLSELGGYTELDYYSVDKSALIFYWHADHLICRYPADEYEHQKSKLDDNYVFQERSIVEFIKDHDNAVCEPSADIDGYHFRLLSCDKYNDIKNYNYPKKIIIIGYSDEMNEIVYISYDDSDVDYIQSLENFILDNCGWEYIR